MEKFKQFIVEETELKMDQLKANEYYEVLNIEPIGNNLGRFAEKDAAGTVRWELHILTHKPVIIKKIKSSIGNQFGIPVKFISHGLDEIFGDDGQDFTYLKDEDYLESQDNDGIDPIAAETALDVFFIRDTDQRLRFKVASSDNMYVAMDLF